MCLRSSNSFLINKESHQVIPVHCKAYHCKQCGPVKASKLRKALNEYLKSWDIIGFWTLTIKQVSTINIDKHHKFMRECWRRFLTYVRRNKGLTEKQRNMKFIKVVEEHKNGFIHYHLAVNVFIPYEIANNIWNSIVEQVTGLQGKNGNVNIKAIQNSKKVASYITKYITKLSLKLAIKLRRYSKSNGLTLFPVSASSGEWIFARWKGQTIEEAILEVDLRSDILVSNKHNFTNESKNLISSIINSQVEDNWFVPHQKKVETAWQFIYEDIRDPFQTPENYRSMP